MSVAARKAVDAPDAPEEFRPRSEFARRLWEIRLRIEAQGGDFLDWEGLEREVAERRGGARWTHFTWLRQSQPVQPSS